MKAAIPKKRTALITGSSKGIGKAISSRFLAEGYFVIENGRTENSITCKSNSEYYQMDLSNIVEIRKFATTIIAQYEKLDVLVCNIGNGRQISETDPEARWAHYLAQNLFCTTYLIEELMPLLLTSKTSVIGISSVAATIATSAPIEYSSAKSALETYFRLMAKQYVKNGLRFNLVAPGNIIFKDSTWDQKLNLDTESVLEQIAKDVPAARFGTPEEIAYAVSFLASSRCGFITGARIVSDGGQSL